VGAFSYSHGIEWLVESGEIHDPASLAAWLTDILLLGSGRNDAILFVQAYQAAWHGEFEGLCDLADTAAAIAGSAERCLETGAQGQAFSDVTRRTWTSASLAKMAALVSKSGQLSDCRRGCRRRSQDRAGARIAGLSACLRGQSGVRRCKGWCRWAIATGSA